MQIILTLAMSLIAMTGGGGSISHHGDISVMAIFDSHRPTLDTSKY